MSTKENMELKSTIKGHHQMDSHHWKVGFVDPDQDGW